jgi:mono/diheme cytochrome c family protein
MFCKKMQLYMYGLRSALLFSISALWCSVSLFTACDSGDILPRDASENTEGVSVSATFRFQHTEAYPVSYDLLFGIFNDASDVPLVSKTLVKPVDRQSATVSISGIPEGAASIRLSLSKSGRKTFYTLYEMPLSGIPAEDITIAEQTVDLLQYGRVQEQVFSQCIACHGGADHAGANLYLTAGRSYGDLVNAPSVKSAKKRVAPANIGGSFLIDVLTDEQVALSYPHSTGISSLKEDDIALLKEWIRNMNGELKIKY